MKVFLQIITELFLDREEFIKLYSPMNKNTKFAEFFCILLGSISLAISAVFVNPPYNNGYLVLIVFLAIGNYLFLSLLASILSFFVDYKSKSLMKTGDFPSLNSSSRCMNIVYIFSGPLAILFSFIGIDSFTSFFSIVLITSSVYVWIFSGYANDLYGIGTFRAFKNIVSSIFFVLYVPFMILFYFLMNLSVII